MIVPILYNDPSEVLGPEVYYFLSRLRFDHLALSFIIIIYSWFIFGSYLINKL